MQNAHFYLENLLHNLSQFLIYGKYGQNLLKIINLLKISIFKTTKCLGYN